MRYDAHGVVGTAVNHAFRLLDSTAFKTEFARTEGPLGVITSSWFFEEVVRHSDGNTSAAYRSIRVTAKETDTTAWIRLGDDTAPTPTSSIPRQLPPGTRHFVGREDELGQLGAFLDLDDAPTVVITTIAGTAGIGKTALATRWANTVRDRFPDGQLHDERARLDTLNLGERDLDVRAVLSWSYRVLSAPAARLFRLLGVHPGPDIDTLACGALLGEGKVGPLLAELTAAHLLEEHDPGRYTFHDLLRVYAGECAEQDEPDLDAAKARIIDFYVDAVTVAHCHIQPWWDGAMRPAPSPASPPHLSGYHDAMAWLTRENATLLAVLDFAARNGLASQVGRLARTFNAFLARTGRRHERVAVHRKALATAPDDHARLVVLPTLARALARLERLEEAESLLDEAAELAGRLRDNDRAIAVETAYVLVLELRERYRDALRHAERLWELTRDQPSPLLHADAFIAIARQRASLGSPAEALPLGERALALYRETNHRQGQSYAHAALGFMYRRLGEHDRAIQCFEQSLTIDRALSYRYWEAHSLHQIGDLYHLKGERDRAATAWEDAAAIFDHLRHPEGTAVRAKLSENS